MKKINSIYQYFNKLSIRHSTLGSAIIPALLMFVLLTPYNLYERTNDMHNALQKQGRVLVDQLAQISEYALITGNTGYLKDTINKLLLDPEIYSIAILDEQNNSIVAGPENQNEVSSTNLLLFKTLVVQTFESVDIFDIADGFSLSDSNSRSNQSKKMTQKIIGSVHVRLTQKILYTQQRKTIINGLFLAMIALAISAFVGHRIGVSITAPISAVVNGVKRIRKGRYSLPIGRVSGNEIGSLALDIDALAKELDSVKKEKEKHIVELTKARDLADRANASKSDFLALISHEIRSPLNSAYGVVQLLDDTKLNGLQKRYVNLALSSFNHLVFLLDDIIDFSALDYGEIKIEHTPVHLQQLIDQVISNYNYVAAQNNLSLDVTFSGEPQLQSSEYYVDPTRIRQIITNFLDNAFKFTQHGGVYVLVDWRALNDQEIVFSLTVKDTGKGIAQDKLDIIFEMFKQASSGSNRVHGGAGLGLYIVKRLAALMGGKITVQSRPGLGSLFTFELHLKPVRRGIGAQKTIDNFRSFSTGRILIVEDDWANQEVIKGLLNHVGIKVDIAGNGKEGLKLFSSNVYDLIFVDCYMPEMDGFEFAQQVRKLESQQGKSRIPMIALTASALPSTEQKCLSAGMDDYIAKPYRKFDIYKRISALYKTEKILSNIMSSSESGSVDKM